MELKKNTQKEKKRKSWFDDLFSAENYWPHEDIENKLITDKILN